MAKNKILILMVTLIVCPLVAGPTIKLQVLSGILPNPPYDLYVVDGAGVFTNGQTLTTFCCEYSEYLPYGYVYAKISDEAILGTPDWDQWGVEYSTKAVTSDPLDTRTAWLYQQYISGAFTDAAAVQTAIYYVEAERQTHQTYDSSWSSSSALWKQYVAAAVNANPQNLGGCVVLNLYLDEACTYRLQDQVTIVPAPGAIVLSSLGIAFVGWLRKTRNAL